MSNCVIQDITDVIFCIRQNFKIKTRKKSHFEWRLYSLDPIWSI
jgi:hypothetical protein